MKLKFNSHNGASNSAVSMVMGVFALTVPLMNIAFAEPVMKATDNLSVGVDLRDVATYKTALRNEARLILKAMTATPEKFFSPGVQLLQAGPGFSAATRQHAVFGVEFIGAPTFDDNRIETILANALYAGDRNHFTIKTFKFEIESRDSSLNLREVTVIREIPLERAHFKIRVALAQRKMIVEDPELGLRKIFPLAVGALSENSASESSSAGAVVPGKVRILTPKYHEALIERRYVESARTYPDYYRGRPFIRISVGQGGKTIYGFHYSITDSLIRGFESHGCMRMRDKDLYELYALVMHGALENIPLEMSYRIENNDGMEGPANADAEADSPYPLENKSYTRVKNFGSAAHPQTDLDRDGLTIVEIHHGAPPISTLRDAPGDGVFGAR